MPATQAVHLLLFSEQGLSFGVPADQVKELLNVNSLATEGPANVERTVVYNGRELQVIQLSRRLKLQEALEHNRGVLSRQDVQPGDKHEPVERGNAGDPEPSPRILIVRHRSEGELGIHVELLTQLRLVPLARIFRLPLIMDAKNQLRSVWGLALIDRRPVVLVDLEHI